SKIADGHIAPRWTRATSEGTATSRLRALWRQAAAIGASMANDGHFHYRSFMARPKKNDSTLPVVGGAIGAALGGPIWLVAGALLGAAVSDDERLSLEDSVRLLLSEQGLKFVSLERPSRSSAELTFKDRRGDY